MNQKILYRVKLVTANDVKTSKVVQLEHVRNSETVVSVVNPFKNNLIIDMNSPEAGKVRVDVHNNNGVLAGSHTFTIIAGSNKLMINNGLQFPPGFYTLRIIARDKVWIKKTLKL